MRSFGVLRKALCYINHPCQIGNGYTLALDYYTSYIVVKLPTITAVSLRQLNMQPSTCTRSPTKSFLSSLLSPCLHGMQPHQIWNIGRPVNEPFWSMHDSSRYYSFSQDAQHAQFPANVHTKWRVQREVQSFETCNQIIGGLNQNIRFLFLDEPHINGSPHACHIILFLP